eukprot:XP_011678194.1 PREDICTED: mucin-12-like [Strongylocentrotus purpuratus]
MGTLRTIAFVFLLCCALVEKNNAVPIPQTTANPALPLETELYTETYTEVVHETVLSSDTEGTIQQRQERPLTGPVAEPSNNTSRDDHQQSMNAEASDSIGQNDSLGGDADHMASSDTDTISDETVLISSEDNSRDADAIVNGDNDTNGSPHEGVNTTAASTRSTPLVLSATHRNTNFISVSTGSAQKTLSDTPQGSASREDERSHHDSNQDEVSATPDGVDLTPKHSGSSSVPHHLTPSTAGHDLTPEHSELQSTLHHSTPSSTGHDLTPEDSEPSATVHHLTSSTPRNSHHTPSPISHHLTPSTAGHDLTPERSKSSSTPHHLTPSASGILHHRTGSIPRAPQDESVENEITPSLEPYVTEMYTEFVERTELVMSDPDSKSEETISAQDEGDAEHRVISKAEDEIDDEPASSTPRIAGILHHTLSTIPHHSTSSTAGNSHHTPSPIPHHLKPRTAGHDLTPEHSETSSTPHHVTPSASGILHHRTESILKNEITPSLEPYVTEMYTEFVERTELVMSDTDSKSKDEIDDDPARSTPIVVSSTPLVVSSISQNTDQIKHSTSSTLPHLSAEPFDFADRMAMTPYDILSSPNTIAMVDTNLTPDSGDITPTLSDPSSSAPDLMPNKGVLTASVSVSSATHHASASSQDRFAGKSIIPFPEPVATEIYTEIMEITELVMSGTESESMDSLSAPEQYDITPEQSDSTPEQYDITPEQYDSTPEQYDIASEQSDSTPEHYDITPEQSDSTPEQYDITPEQSDGTPEQYDITPEQYDITPEQYEFTPEQSESDSMPEQYDIAPEQSDLTPDQYDITSDQYDGTPEQYGITPEQSDSMSEQTDTAPEQSDSTPVQADGIPEQYDITPEQSNFAPEQYSTPEELALYIPETAEVTSPYESFVTETYTEIMEITELSLSDTESKTKSEENILAQVNEDSEAVQESTRPAPVSSSATSHDTTVVQPVASYTASPTSQKVIAEPSDTTSTTDGPAVTPERSDPSVAYVTPTEHQTLHPRTVTSTNSKLYSTRALQDNDISQEDELEDTAQLFEPIVTEMYTEVIEFTELMADTDEKSDDTFLAPESEDSVQQNVDTNEGEDNDYTPSSDENESLFTPNAIVSSLATPALVQESTRESLNKSSTGPSSNTVHVPLNITMSNTHEISTALVDTISTLEISDSTPDSPDYTLDSSDSTPASSDNTPDSPYYTLESSDSTPDSPYYTLDSSDSMLDNSDSTLESSDSTPDSPDNKPDSSDSTPDSPYYTLDNSDSTQDSSDSTLESSDSKPDSPDNTPDSSDSTPDSTESTLGSPYYTLDSSYPTLDDPDYTLDYPDYTLDNPDTTPGSPETTLNNSNSTPKETIQPTTTTESTLDEPSNTHYPASPTKGAPNGDSVTPSQEPFVTDIYTEIMEITELLMSDEKD